MTALDTLDVATTLPVLRVDLHAGLSDLEWTVNAALPLSAEGGTGMV